MSISRGGAVLLLAVQAWTSCSQALLTSSVLNVDTRRPGGGRCLLLPPTTAAGRSGAFQDHFETTKISQEEIMPYFQRGQSMALLAGRGGGGFGSTSTSQKKNLKNDGSKPRKKQRRGSFQELEKEDKDVRTSTIETSKTQEPVLDKWGLPPPTLDDIFPPLPEDTELLPCHAQHEYSRTDIIKALERYVPMSSSLEACFDEQGWEQPRPQTDRPPMQLKLVHISPPVLVIENFLTPQECVDIEQVADLAGNSPRNQPAALVSKKDDYDAVVQVNSATFGGGLSTRTSSSWFCRFSKVPTLIGKMHRILGFPVYHMEEPQIVRYQNGQEFSWHYDQVPPQQLHNGGQRLATVLVYLNSLESAQSLGGSTVFRDLQQPSSSSSKASSESTAGGAKSSATATTTATRNDSMLAVQPRQGRACIFFPAFADGTPDDRTLHKGEMIVAQSSQNSNINNNNNEKRIVQVWIHQRPYQPVLPPGNKHDDVLDMIQQPPPQQQQ
ncbi:hypothetical protein ACA910_009373 [Epithemia clementina (nom. ined.)]